MSYLFFNKISRVKNISHTEIPGLWTLHFGCWALDTGHGFWLVQMVHLLVHLYIYKYWRSPLSATPLYYQVHPELYHQAHLKRIYHFFRLYCHSYFQFLIDQILHPFAPLSSFLSAFSSAFHIRSHLKSQLHLLGELFLTLLCSSKQIVDCTLKSIYTNVCIIFSDGIVLLRSTTF